LSKRHRVHVVTWEGERNGIRDAIATDRYPNLSFTYLGRNSICHPNRLVARLQSWRHYLTWTDKSLDVARKLVADQQFDLVHHVTYSSWRVPSPLWQLNLPFVWGPVGGAAEYPLRLLGKLSLHSALFEVARNFSNYRAAQSSALRNCVRKSTVVVASNRETFDKLLGLRGRSDGMHLQFPTFFTDQQVAMFQCDPADKPPVDPIHLFAGGNMIGSKGLIFALEALKIAAQKGIKWRLVIGGHGPEVPFLQKKARSLGIEAWIEFHMGFSGSEYVNKLKEAHVFILPSFRENAGITMLEAMLAGCVPIIVDASAQAAVVDSQCGFKIPVGEASAISAGLANALEILALNPEQRIEMGRKASAAVEHTFREETYVRRMSAIYEEAVRRKLSRLSS
jgi:glycosyltransferase involved in cell wall biosynthesis